MTLEITSWSICRKIWDPRDPRICSKTVWLATESTLGPTKMPVRLTMLMCKGIDIYFFICNMTMFWRSWILSFWPQPLSPLRGSDRGLWSKITFDMFHIYYTSWHKFWHLDPSVGRGGSLLAKYFLPCCCICDSSLIWYVTGPCSEQVEFWPIDPKGWVGGGVCRQNICYHFAALVIYLNLMCNMFMFWKSCILTLRPPVLAGGGGGGGGVCWQNIPYYVAACVIPLIWYATWPYSEEVEFWALDPTTYI